MRPRVALVVWLVAGLAAFPARSRSACPPDGGALCTAPGDQYQLAGDALFFDFGTLGPIHGMYVAWTDLRNASTSGPDIYYTRNLSCVDSTTATGAALCTEPGAQERPSLAISGKPGRHPFPGTQGFGVPVVWQDARGADWDIYSRRVAGATPFAPGPFAWDMTSIAICTETGDQTVPQVVGWGYGGAIAAWVDRRSGNADIYAQCLDSVGTALWGTGGIPVCTASGDQTDLRIIPDSPVAQENRGAWLFWLDWRGDAAIYGMRLDASGAAAPGWSANGNRVSGSPAVPLDFVARPTGGGASVVFWTDARDDPGGDVYGQRIEGDGTIATGWSADGQVVAAGPDAQTLSDATSDSGAGGFAIWIEEPSALDAPFGATDADLRAQHVTDSGAIDPAWPANGVVICDAPGRQDEARADARDWGFIVIWTDRRNGQADPDLYGVGIETSGAVRSGWTPGGTVISDAADAQQSVLFMKLGRLAWVDDRDRGLNGADVYGSNVTDGGQVEVPAPLAGHVALGPAQPNPSRGTVSFALDLVENARVDAAVVDLAGRTVRRIASGHRLAGSGWITWDGADSRGNRAAPGVYFVAVRVDGTELKRRFVRIR
ncbi:MAG TPA: FlgD immunoglobulin-like domain containing protein [Candidatus Eisenbacteria bacterium]|jgi:hypothetical protein